MNKMIITVFNTEEQAFEGLTAFKTLHKNGDIKVSATAVINKNDAGEVEMKQVSDNGPVGTAIGTLSGALIGLIAGPAGMAFGAMAGMYGGMFYDLDNADVDSTFLNEVAKALEDGKTALIADVDEAWTAPVDNKMNALDAMVYRRNKSEVAEDQFNRELDALDSEIDELEQDLKEAHDEMKVNIQKQIDKSKARSLAIKNVVDQGMSNLKAETSAKTEKLNKQIKVANKKSKEQLEKNYAATKKSLVGASEYASKYIT
ncbi:DUF1269 domain-containing protein [Algibacter mikhailovii]|uniref:DUF1269 domain-containing protein n=1 Tax=Algibacter mikhailovii TaxID=425498 RepID=A0A918QW09_9FLAO|nr:DUF1269 domain-containing protein [Algibacter mikhailovii]GGZ74856.1 hypothetical protein GCM10007028_10310 [Algibacter mikhailovii]